MLGLETWRLNKAGWALLCVPLLVSASAAERPNIVLIMADDLGFSDFGCYGSEIPTPNIDALARTGLRFAEFYNNGVCGPTRASLLTGLYAQRIGHSGGGWNDPTNYRECMTVGEALQQAGYHTMMAGKWQGAELPADLGFDRSFAMVGTVAGNYFSEVRGNPIYLDRERWRKDGGFYKPKLIADFAVQFLEEALSKKSDEGKRRPFFLYLSQSAPHWPLHASEEAIAPHRERYRQTGWTEWRERRRQRQIDSGLIPSFWEPGPFPDRIPTWKKEPHKEWQAERMAIYAAQVAAVDESVGRVMATLRKAGAAESTLVLVLSDNGAARNGAPVPKYDKVLNRDASAPGWRLDGVPMRIGSGPKVMPGPSDTFDAYGQAWATVSNTPFRNFKQSAFEGGVRTPLVAHWPAVTKGNGQVVQGIGHVMDFMPTFLELAGVSFPGEYKGRKLLPLDGGSFAAALRGEKWAGRTELCWNLPPTRGIRKGEWKLVETKGESPVLQLFQIANDGPESKDLALQFPEIARDLAARWQQWSTRVTPAPE